MQHWYLIQSKVRKEELAFTQLQRQEYQVYLPKVKLRKHLRGHWKEVVESLFPRYLFIRLDDETQNWGPIRSTIGVSNLVRFGMQPAIVPDEIIATLQSREDSYGIISLVAKDPFSKGDKLRVADGPLQQLEAVFEAKSGEERSIILVQMLGQQRRVTISNDLLLPAS